MVASSVIRLTGRFEKLPIFVSEKDGTMKRTTILPLLALATLLSATATAQNTMNDMDTLNLSLEWDKTFPQS